MIISQRIWDRFLALGLYGLIAAGMIWFGSRLVNHAIDTRFYHDYLAQWEMALTAFRYKSGVFPVFSGGNHRHYMELLVTAMNRNSTAPPSSNSVRPFFYVIDKIGYKANRIFILALSDRMVIYNLPRRTINTLDKMIDGHEDLSAGGLTGVQSKDGITYIGIWKL